MADSENPQPFGQPPVQEDERNWAPMAIGAGLVVAGLVAIVLFTSLGKQKAQTPDPYIAKLEVGGLHMARAENFAGGSVTYILGRIANNGDKKVTGARVEVIFKNSIGEISLKETVPVAVRVPNAPYEDYGPLDSFPLAPGQLRDFRVTLEYVTPDWDGQVPQVKLVAVTY